MCLARHLWCMFLNYASPFNGNLYGYVSAVNEAKNNIFSAFGFEANR